MAVLGNIATSEPLQREDKLRIAAAIFSAFGFHLLLFQALMFKTPEPFQVEEDVIAVELVTLPPQPQTPEPIERPPKINEVPLPPPPNVAPRPKPTPPSVQSPATDTPDILASSRLATVVDEGNTESESA